MSPFSTAHCQAMMPGGFTLGSKTKETPESSNLVGGEQISGPKGLHTRVQDQRNSTVQGILLVKRKIYGPRGFRLRSKTKETPELSDPIGGEQISGAKEFTLGSGSKV